LPGQITVKGAAEQLVFSLYGASLYVTHYVASLGKTRLAVIDTSTKQAIASLGIPKSHLSALALALNPSGDPLYVAEPNHLQFFDTTTNTWGKPIALKGLLPRGAAVTPDGKYLYVAAGQGGVAMFDVVTRKYISSFTVGIFPYSLAITPSGNYAYVSDIDAKQVLVVDISEQ
jgi:DNA-binding beta-propeller fold protein YncE